MISIGLVQLESASTRHKTRKRRDQPSKDPSLDKLAQWTEKDKEFM